MCSPWNHPSQVNAYIQRQVFGPKSGLICKNRSCVWCILDVSSVFLSDARVVRSHGVVSRGPGSAKTAQVRLRKDGLGTRDAMKRASPWHCLCGEAKNPYAGDVR